MRQFNLEEAKAGKPVCTLDGRKVRILCFDRKNCNPSSIVGLIEEEFYESIHSWRTNGITVYNTGKHTDDIFMV